MIAQWGQSFYIYDYITDVIAISCSFRPIYHKFRLSIFILLENDLPLINISSYVPVNGTRLKLTIDIDVRKVVSDLFEKLTLHTILHFIR